MSRSADEVVSRARSLVGIPFRAQGRDPAIGLDCIGVILASFGLSAEGVRKDYRLRGLHRSELEAELSKRFRRIAPGRSGRGDILLCAPATHQLHLAVNCGGSFVHADAGLRRVVETPGEPPWPVASAFRRRQTRQRSG